MKKKVLLILVLMFSIALVSEAKIEKPVKVLNSGKEIAMPQQAVASSPIAKENRLIVPKISAIDKAVFWLKGCKVLHNLKDKTAMVCPEDVVVQDAKPDRIFKMHDLEADVMINADDVWNLGYNGTGVLVAILDTGVDDTHIELSDSIVATENFISGPSTDQNGHGTHVSGIITGNGIYEISGNYATGVAPGADLIVGKVCGTGGCYESDIMAGIEWAVAQGAKILSMSLGGGNFGSHCDSDLLAAKVNWAVSQGLVVIVSSGNDGAGVSSPACASGAIAVGSVNKSDVLASSSNYGSALDIVAPGVSILSTYSCVAAGDCKSYWYAHMSGTSMAAPHVAGAAALILEKNPGYTVDDVKTALYSTAVDLGAAGWDQYYGNGRVDVLRAVSYSECTDADEDGYFLESRGCEGEPNYNGHNDCNDADENKWRNIDSLYTDNDLDGWTLESQGGYSTRCVGDDFVHEGRQYYSGSSYLASGFEIGFNDVNDGDPLIIGEGLEPAVIPEFSTMGITLAFFIIIIISIAIIKNKKYDF